VELSIVIPWDDGESMPDGYECGERGEYGMMPLRYACEFDTGMILRRPEPVRPLLLGRFGRKNDTRRSADRDSDEVDEVSVDDEVPRTAVVAVVVEQRSEVIVDTLRAGGGAKGRTLGDVAAEVHVRKHQEIGPSRTRPRKRGMNRLHSATRTGQR
jgi:hypothetical protein